LERGGTPAKKTKKPKNRLTIVTKKPSKGPRGGENRHKAFEKHVPVEHKKKKKNSNVDGERNAASAGGGKMWGCFREKRPKREKCRQGGGKGGL